MSETFMEDNEEFQGDHLTHATSFSQLLFGDDDDVVDHYTNTTLRYSSLFSIGNAPKMLCFGNDQSAQVAELLLSETNAVTTPQKSVITSSESSSASSSCNHNSNNKKRNGLGQEPARCTDSIVTAASGGRRQPKKTKAENPSSTGHAKRKEKLGERIAALQQLVSPFGKTDTASVLHEAMGYIRFLHDQVQVLCSPYLQRLPYSPHHHRHQPGDGENKRDLRSRGLCLIPVESTIHVARSNGADFWSPAMGSSNNNNNDNNNNVSSSTRQ